jgi:hypothetical protein
MPSRNRRSASGSWLGKKTVGVDYETPSTLEGYACLPEILRNTLQPVAAQLRLAEGEITVCYGFTRK